MGRLGAVVVLAIVAAGLGILASDTHDLRCERASGRCVEVHRVAGVERDRREFALGEVAAIEYTQTRRARTDEGATVVTLADGSRLRVARGAPGWARDRAEALRGFVFEEQASHVEARATPQLGLSCPTLALFGSALALWVSLLLRVRRLELVVDPEAALLVATPRRLVGRMPPRVLALAGLRRVHVDRGPMTTPTRRDPQPLEGARLVLVYEDGTSLPVTERRHPAPDALEDVATELRSALGVD